MASRLDLPRIERWEARLGRCNGERRKNKNPRDDIRRARILHLRNNWRILLRCLSPNGLRSSGRIRTCDWMGMPRPGFGTEASSRIENKEQSDDASNWLLPNLAARIVCI